MAAMALELALNPTDRGLATFQWLDNWLETEIELCSIEIERVVRDFKTKFNVHKSMSVMIITLYVSL